MEHIASDDSDRDGEKASESAGGLLTPEQLGRRDDDAIVATLTGRVIEEYVYSVRQDGSVVDGLTHAGVAELARLRGGIQIDDVRFEEKASSWIAAVRATDSYTGASRIGTYEQPMQANGVDDAHAFTKAVHKAQRNAVEQLLPTAVVKEFISSHRPGRASSAAPAPAASQQKTAAAGIGRRQKAAFAIAQRLRDALERREISQEDLWNFVRRRFNVQSRNDMREEQWALLVSEWDAAATSKGKFEELVTKVARIQQAGRDGSARPAQVARELERDAPEEPDDDDEGTVVDSSLDEDKSESVGPDSAQREE